MWPVDGGEAKLMKNGETFVVATPDPNNPGYMTYYEHTDLAMLRAYLDETWSLSLPKIPEENGA